MPVIIDQLDLVDTQPAPSGGPPAPPTSVGASDMSADRVAGALHLATRRAARVQAD
jgi:hypothetical protein